MKVRSTYSKYSKVPGSTGATGYDVARRILDAHGLYDVQIEEIRGVLSDHYDPRSKVVRLSSDIYHGHSLAAIAVAAHECGHALQDQEDYAFLRFRSALVPLASFGSNISWILIIAGIFFTMTNLLLLGIIFMAFAVLFQVVTLPVEFNASSRAMNQVVELGLIRNEEESGARKVLNAAAMTYVAAAAVAVIELLRFILMYVAMNDD
ncbi:zinc metallopeptidase [Caldibacillus thermolactis]|uniref:Zinc metallopeptidase n=1 Tax=Pallidibacillus thermolactis TaxID=251051 RepID=A0ABT2WFH5_9BACI|nr:zinc metallopeptidase [Pallidibacillus thermolactis]MCU9593686.1 zinc metallopeptidase [Pallidibacillus thermolactis]MCU9599814.1 zinc metallopeptidase [Pallidibacillus thermolactis subsp. kokeshiiformis]MED1673841.1 zinc metallopeptidase [Pallidibacillus thermolactis subsp. kokeshiiformis]